MCVQYTSRAAQLYRAMLDKEAAKLTEQAALAEAAGEKCATKRTHSAAATGATAQREGWAGPCGAGPLHALQAGPLTRCRPPTLAAANGAAWRHTTATLMCPVPPPHNPCRQKDPNSASGDLADFHRSSTNASDTAAPAETPPGPPDTTAGGSGGGAAAPKLAPAGASSTLTTKGERGLAQP